MVRVLMMWFEAAWDDSRADRMVRDLLGWFEA